MSRKITSSDATTSLDDDDISGLIPGLTTRNELNEFEQQNIAQAIIWAENSRKLKRDLLSMQSLKLLHQKMFGETWSWAGKFRTTGKTLGVEPHLIQTELAKLFADVKYWLQKKTFPYHICAIKFHHRLVYIHPFPNGNGRVSRLIADLMMIFANKERFTWGGKSLNAEGKTREKYIAALKQADKGKYKELVNFAVSK